MGMNKLERNKETKNRIQVVLRHPTAVSKEKINKESLTSMEHQPLQNCVKKLDRLVGLSSIKTFIHEIYAWLEIAKKRRQAGLLTEMQVLHMIFTGNPGTGKTTVARLIAELFKEMGVLSKGHLIEVERADLVGEYIGHTAQKTREHIKRALGGVLFLDEAYSLARGGEKDFGREAIDTMVKAMEDYNNQFVLILAGYEKEMYRFLRSNPGLPSRFPIHLSFPDFQIEELMEIADLMVMEREYRFSIPAKEKLRAHLQQKREADRLSFGNARYVRNLIEQAIRHQAVRLLDRTYVSKDELMTLRAEDLLFDEEDSKSNHSIWYNQHSEKRIWDEIFT